MQVEKPVMDCRNLDGNIFYVLGEARRVLKKAGQKEKVKEMSDRVIEAESYDQALAIIFEYVDPEF